MTSSPLVSASFRFNMAEENHVPGLDLEASLNMDVGKFSQDTLRVALAAIGKSNDLLNGSKDFDFYNSFKGFRKFMNAKSGQIIQLMSEILFQQEIKCRLNGLDMEEVFDAIVEANDLILEKVGASIDEASGVNKIQTPILVAAASSRAEINTSWNRKSAPQGRTLRLLAAHNILRPQLKFMDKIDNSPNPFVPIITEKPNSIKPLSIILEQTEYGEMYTHPYQCELDHYHPKESQLQAAVEQHVTPLNETDFIFVNTVDQVIPLVNDLKQQTEIAVDLEHHSYRSFQGITCLMQISTRSRDYLIDTLELWNDLQILNEVFTDKNIVKVFHGADKDIEWLQRDLGIYVVNMFDTGQASRLLNFAHFSLAYLLKHYCQVDADKQYQLADWRIRPLPDEMVRYAREDTHYLLYIYDKMKNELIAKGNQVNNLLTSVFQKSRVICEKRYVKPIFSPDGYLDLCKKYGKIFNTKQMYALREVFCWRNTVARMEDESLGFVLPNHMLIQIAEVLPREMQGILACCNPVPPLVRQYLNELHQIILKAREQSLETRVVQQLQIQIDENRREIDLDNVLFCPHDLKATGAIDAGPTLLDLWNKHGDELEKELQVHNIGIPVKPKAEMAAFIDPDSAKLSKDVKSALKSVNTLMSNLLSHFDRYTLLCTTKSESKDDENKEHEVASHLKNVEDHFMKLVESHKRPQVNPQESILTPESTTMETNEENVGEIKNVESPVQPTVEDFTPIRKTLQRKRKRPMKKQKKALVEDNVVSPKKKKLEINEADFKPFDYSQVKQSKGKKKNKRLPHDPTQNTVSYKKGNLSKTNLKGKGKSMTFTSKKRFRQKQKTKVESV